MGYYETTIEVDGEVIDRIAVERAVSGAFPRPVLTRAEYAAVVAELNRLGYSDKRKKPILAGLRRCIHAGCGVPIPETLHSGGRWLCGLHSTKEARRERELLRHPERAQGHRRVAS